MSLQPPARAKIGDIWVDPITGHRFVFTGETWEPWQLVNEWFEYMRGEEAE